MRNEARPAESLHWRSLFSPSGRRRHPERGRDYGRGSSPPRGPAHGLLAGSPEPQVVWGEAGRMRVSGQGPSAGARFAVWGEFGQAARRGAELSSAGLKAFGRLAEASRDSPADAGGGLRPGGAAGGASGAALRRPREAPAHQAGGALRRGGRSLVQPRAPRSPRQPLSLPPPPAPLFALKVMLRIKRHDNVFPLLASPREGPLSLAKIRRIIQRATPHL